MRAVVCAGVCTSVFFHVRIFWFFVDFCMRVSCGRVCVCVFLCVWLCACVRVNVCQLEPWRKIFV